MNKIFVVSIVLLMLFSCDKENTAPIILVNSPNDGELYNINEDVFVDVKVDDIDLDLVDVSMILDRDTLNYLHSDVSFNGYFECRFPLLYLGTGSHYLKVSATDKSYDRTVVSRYFHVYINGEPGEGCVDIDFNEYKTVIVGDQEWMAENLKVTHYPDGLHIPQIEDYDDLEQVGYADDAMCFYDFEEGYKDRYGALYSWPAAMNGEVSSSGNPSGVQGVCPDGWHLPSAYEWDELKENLGGDVAAGKMKEEGYEHWMSPNTGALNVSGFDALPAGFSHLGHFDYLTAGAKFWSSRAFVSSYSDVTDEAFILSLEYDSEFASIRNGATNDFFSIRCVKD